MGIARRHKRKEMMKLYRLTKKVKLANPRMAVKECIAEAKEKLKPTEK